MRNFAEYVISALRVGLCVVYIPIDRSRGLQGKPISDHKTALVVLRQCRPFFTRVPLENKDGMSKSCHLALEVNDFDLKGSYGEDTWGSPKSVETADPICDWVAGLKEDGGGGCVDSAVILAINLHAIPYHCRNILKLRKAERNQREEPIIVVPKVPVIIQQKLDLHAFPIKRHVERPKSRGEDCLPAENWSKFWRVSILSQAPGRTGRYI